MSQDDTGKRAIHSIEQLQRLLSSGYILRLQQVNGDVFLFGNNMNHEVEPVSCKARTLIECTEQMEIGDNPGKET